MTLKATIREDMTAAMKARDKQRTGALRMLLAAIQQEETNGTKHDVDDATTLKIIAREIKKRRESAELYAANGRQELADAELFEASVFETYQPAQLDDDSLNTLVAEVIAAIPGEATMGQVMKLAQEKASGRVDGKRLSTAVRAALGN
ncbi:Uncharacterized conserved protein [Corynebacterium kutscheri]|uniref:Uncharacterized conserved protein n=1 Tax=Corynebacterium kutscheri TaxID=35755 RepID=A0A0F6TC33_9CORY|nr:GatB/YqeY domain-containing protein [Corynebacterium kutscheri]AKE40406.1 hypothetical protein UL82_00865 [Corynebacterium kutscheri]VEH05267.1 Uncharacterized conserved protein [Corynebacterium kutscheri]VEH10801.1 Uncharacterized conserved protein [Corynebacterium kutscheri]VEH80720.1 Uncharacterized conserved protein [Corynebacterium kutscheri]